MAVFYVDYSTTGSEGLNGIEELLQGDVVYIYYDFFSDALPMRMLKKIGESSARIELVDMKLRSVFEPISIRMAAELGYEVGKGDNNVIVAVSESRSVKRLTETLEQTKSSASLIFASSIELGIEEIELQKEEMEQAQSKTDVNHQPESKTVQTQNETVNKTLNQENPPQNAGGVYIPSFLRKKV